MVKKVKTINLQGNDYAGVPERIRLFREDCPKGKIITKHVELENGELEFKAYVWKDKADVKYSQSGQVVPDSADATGSARGQIKASKGFEKLETISIGRGLAILGYLASGEIASSEEMEAFNEYKDEKIELALVEIKNANSIEELKTIFLNLGSLMTEQKIIDAKDLKKKELSQ